jgi:hypothetical protein
MSDVAGFTELMRANEPHTMASLRSDMEILQNHILKQDGEVVKVAGDGLLALFSSAPRAVRACIDAQEEMASSSLKHRIAIHAGEVTMSGGDAYGDAVNVCSRIESQTLPGSVSASKIVIDLIKSQDLPEPFRNGKVQLKGIEHPIEVYSWGNSKTYSKGSKLKTIVGSIMLGLVMVGGYFAFDSFKAKEVDIERSPRTPFSKTILDGQNTPVAMSAEDALDLAYDEVWQEKEDFDKVKEEAVKALKPQLVIDWLNQNPLGLRERGRREVEHWSLVNQAMDKGKSMVDKEATPRSILSALKTLKDPSLEIAIKAFEEEFHILK